MPSERVQRRIDGLLDDAEAAAARRDWEEVAQSLRMVLRLDPENEDALAFETMLEGELEAHSKGSDTAPTPDLSVVDGDQSPPTPTSFANDRYQVSKFLGEGGKKRVYQAHDTLLDREVAFALIKTEGFDFQGGAVRASVCLWRHDPERPASVRISPIDRPQV